MMCKKRFEAQGSTCNVFSCTSQQGFSLIEFLVTILLSSIVMGAIYSVYRVQTRSMKVQENRMEAQQYARSVLDLMVREIRNAGFNPLSVTNGNNCAGGSQGTPSIVTANATTLRFTYDFQGTTASSPPDGHCDNGDEDLTYSFDIAGCPSGFGNITRKEGTNAAVALTDCNVATGTANFSFTYYPKDCLNNFSTPVETPPGSPSCPGTPGGNAGIRANIKRVTISLIVQSKHTGTEFGGGQINATMTSNIDLRNR